MSYSARQLMRYYRHCKANPNGRVLPPGGQVGWDDMSAAEWLKWFRECLTEKISRGTNATGKGSKSARRAREIANANAQCKWCGTKTGNVSVRFCDVSCARSYSS